MNQASSTEQTLHDNLNDHFSDKTAVLLIAHGSRRQEANDELATIAEMIQAKLPEKIVRYSFLEIAQPSIPEGVEQCVEKGAKQVVMSPYFLSMGRHVADDLERFRKEFRKKYPTINFQIAPPLGKHPLMIEILLARLEDAH